MAQKSIPVEIETSKFGKTVHDVNFDPDPEIAFVKSEIEKNAHIPVGGRLSKFHKEWKALGASKTVIRWLKRGYPLPFIRNRGHLPELALIDKCPPDLVTNYEKNSVKCLALEDKINELLLKKAIAPLPPNTKGFFNRVFLREKKSGGWRLIIDVSSLNQHLNCQTFHMDTCQVIREALETGLWASSVDFSDAYHHIPMASSAWKYLCFQIGDRLFLVYCVTVRFITGSTSFHVSNETG